MLTLGFLSILELTPIFDVIEQPVAMDAAPVEPKVLRLLIMASRTRRFATEPLRLRCCCCGGRGGFAPPPHTAVTLAAVNAAAAVVAPILGIARHALPRHGCRCACGITAPGATAVGAAPPLRSAGATAVGAAVTAPLPLTSTPRVSSDPPSKGPLRCPAVGCLVDCCDVPTGGGDCCLEDCGVPTGGGDCTPGLFDGER